MPLYAVEDLDDALDATRAFLLPVDRTKWLKLALVAFFIAGPGGNVNSTQYNLPTGGGGPPIPGGFDLGPGELALIAAIVGAVFVVALAFMLAGSIMEFVFVESLREGTVTIRRFWGRRWRQGIRLWAFRIVLGLLTLGAVGIVAGIALLPAITGSGGFSIAALLLLLPVFFVVVLVVGLVNGFTTVFVVPIMIVEDCGVLAGWRRLWSTVVDQWTQYLAYAFAGFVLSIAGGILVGIATVVLGIVVLVPFGLIGAVGVGLLPVVSPVGLALIVLAAVLFVLSMLVVVALVQVPVQTYLRYYALFVLGDTNADLDPIPDVRAAAREE